MPLALVVIGLIIIAAAIAIELIAFLIHIAVPVGILLVIIGLIWHFARPAPPKPPAS